MQVQTGGCKDFDPEIYRQAIRQYNSSKVSAPRAAYRGAGDILHHPGASRPESQQVDMAHGTAASSQYNVAVAWRRRDDVRHGGAPRDDTGGECGAADRGGG